MISFTRSYLATDGKCYATLEEAQAVEIALLFSNEPDAKRVADGIVANKDSILSILTLTDASRPKARGQKKPRKAKSTPEATEPATAP
jgi:hypothetical protein